jgi:hypothetical protein
MERITKLASFFNQASSPVSDSIVKVSKDMQYHIDNKISIANNIFRCGSDAYFKLIDEARKLASDGSIYLSEYDMDFLDSDLGKFAEFQGEMVPLDLPFAEDDDMTKEAAEFKGKKVELGKPKRGGSKKFYVYVKCGDRVKKVSFGDPGLSIKISDPERRKSFVARHKCHQKNDRCTAGYWSCRIGRYPSLTGAKKSYTWW